MSLTQPDEVTKVVKRAKSLGIPLMDFVGKINKTYVTGGVTGFEFQPKSYDEFKAVVSGAAERMKMGVDDEAGDVGCFMGSDAARHGYAISAREFSAGSSLHLELGRLKCDAHVDSQGITPGNHANVPLWGDRYDPIRLIPHGINDLLPSMIGESFVATKMINPVLGRLSIEMRYKGVDLITDGRYPSANILGVSPVQVDKPNNQVMFNLTFEL